MREFRQNNKKNPRDKIGLELVQINIERTIKAEGRGDGRNNLGNQTVEVREARGDNTELLLANVVDSFVINLFSKILVTVVQRYLRC